MISYSFALVSLYRRKESFIMSPWALTIRITNNILIRYYASAISKTIFSPQIFLPFLSGVARTDYTCFNMRDNSRIIIDIEMAERVKILEEDIAELKQLSLQAESPRIQNHLAQLLSQFKTELEQLQSAINTSLPPKKEPVPVVSSESAVDPLKYTSLTKYAWDQEGSKVKLIFSLDGVGKECTNEQVDVIFDKWSVEMRLKGYKGQNFIFSVKKLFAEIVPADSKYLLKNNSLTIVLVKRENKSWTQIAYKEDKLGKTEKEEKADDPSAGIMNMMKKMYEEGDENMKRTIAEAWTKANDKKSQGEQPDFKDRYDFLNKK